MGWVKLDDGFPMHPKVVGLTLDARWAYVEALCYAARYETDGIVPDAVLRTDARTRAELVAAGLWESATGSIAIHDYLVYNPSRSERERNRNRTRTDRASREGDGSRSGVVDLQKQGVDFDEFWTAYPRKVGKPKARVAFGAAVKAGADPGEIVVGAERYRDDPNRDDTFTAHPTTWLHRDGWNDPPLPPRNGSRSASEPDDGLSLVERIKAGTG